MGVFRSVMWGAPAGLGGGWVGGNKFNTSGAWRGREELCILSGGWMLDYFTQWDKWDWLAVFSRTQAGWVLMAACKAEAVVVDSSETSPEAQWGIVDSETSPMPCMPCALLDWGGDNRKLWRCALEGGRKEGGVKQCGLKGWASQNQDNRTQESVSLFK